MARLSNCRRYYRVLLDDGREVNLHKGRVVGRGTDILFYLYRQKRVFVSEPSIAKWLMPL